MSTAMRHGPRPVRLSPVADLTPEQRRLALVLKREAVDPCVRLRFVTLGVLLAVASGVGFVLGLVTPR